MLLLSMKKVCTQIVVIRFSYRVQEVPSLFRARLRQLYTFARYQYDGRCFSEVEDRLPLSFLIICQNLAAEFS